MQNGLFHITSYFSSTFTTIIIRLCRNSVRISFIHKASQYEGKIPDRARLYEMPLHTSPRDNKFTLLQLINPHSEKKAYSPSFAHAPYRPF